MGCKEKTDIDLSRIEITNQSDIDFYCDHLSDNPTYDGTIFIDASEELDYKCLSSIKHINGELILHGPGSSKAFKDLESIVGNQVFSICDELVDTICFPNLKIVDNGQGISINSSCNFSNVLYLPEIEKLTSLTISSPFTDEERSGTLLGFNKIIEIIALRLDNGNQGNNFKIDGFENLERVVSTFNIMTSNEEFQVSESSFNSLEVANEFQIFQSSESNFQFSLEYLIPNLRVCESLNLFNVQPKELCYLKERIELGDINANVLNTITNQFYGNEGVIELCD